MNVELKKLLDKKGGIVKQMEDAYRNVKTRSDKKATADEDRQFDAWDKELEDVNTEIKHLERQSRIDAEKRAIEDNRIDDNKEPKLDVKADNEERARVYNKSKSGKELSSEERAVLNTIHRDEEVFEKWLRFGMDGLSVEERKVMHSRSDKEQRAQSKTTTAGGYTVPEGFGGRIIESMAFISELLNWANIVTTSNGIDIPFPTNDDTANVGELIAENNDLSSSSADLVFGQKTLKAYKFSSKMIKVSNELLQDTGVPLEPYINKQFANRVARITNTYFTTGAGTTEPSGYATDTIGATEGADSGASVTLTADSLLDLMHSVDPAYRSSPKCAWAFHDLLLAYIKKLSHGSSDDRPLWLPSIREGEPDTLYGKPYFVNQAQDSSINTGNKPVFFGDWDQYYVRIVNNFSMRRLTERYAEFDQVAFFGLARMDGMLMNTAAIKYLDSAT